MSLIEAFLLDPLRQPNDIWLALRTDGQKGCGTQSDPFNVSTLFGNTLNPSSITRGGTDNREATVNVTNMYSDGDEVEISGATGDDAAFYNGRFVLYGVSGSSFKYRMRHPGPAANAIGSPACRKVLAYLFDRLLLTNLAAEPPMPGLPPNAIIHLGPGTIETRGLSSAGVGWYVKSGQRFVGSGMDVTTLKLCRAEGVGQLFSAMGWKFGEFLDGFEASDFTVDCNLRNQPIPQGHDFAPVACTAISVNGKHLRLNRIRAIHFGTQTNSHECFNLAASAALPTQGNETLDNVIEDCIAEHPSANNFRETSILHHGSGESVLDGVMAFHRACEIRRCHVNADYVDRPVAIESIALPGSGNEVTVTTPGPHGRGEDEWIVISGVMVDGSLDNTLNGTHEVSEVMSTTQFKFIPKAENGTPSLPPPTSSLTGQMWLGRYGSHLVPIKEITFNAGTVTLVTHRPHNRLPDNNVRIEGVSDPAFNGEFPVQSVVSPKTLTYKITGTPGPSWNTDGAFLGVQFHGLSLDGGTAAVAEANQIYGVRNGGPYHDTFGTRSVLARDNYYANVVVSLFQNLGSTSLLKLGSSLIRQGTTATFYTENDHGLDDDEEVIVRGALIRGFNGIPTYANPYNGKFTLPTGTDPNSTSFSYTMEQTPGQNANGSPVFGEVKTGSSLIRKTGSPATAVLTSIQPHGLISDQTVSIRGARIGNSYPTDFNATNEQITVPTGSTTTFEYDLGGGSSSDPDASDSPVFGTEQGADSLTHAGLVATFETSQPTGLFVGQIVKVSGADDSRFNGVFRVASVANNHGTPEYKFTYTMEEEPTGSAGSSAVFTVFQSASSIALQSTTFAVNKYFTVTTPDKHRLQLGETVSIWGALIDGTFANAFNGAFRVENIKSDFEFECAVDINPLVNPTGTIQWASQNSTPLALEVTGSLVFGVFTTDKPAETGTIFNEGDLLSMFGAVVNRAFTTPTGQVNGYNTVVRVEPNPTARSFRFEVVGPDPGMNASGAPVCALAVATPLTVDGTTATFRTVFDHGLEAGQGIWMKHPLPATGAEFAGFFSVASTPTGASMTWEYETALGGNAPPGYQFAGLWQTGQIVAEGNTVELTSTRHPDSGFGPSAGILMNGTDFRPQYTFRRVLARENSVRLMLGISSSQSTALGVTDAEKALVGGNVAKVESALPFTHNRSESVTYFENKTPQGTLLQGADAFTLQATDELATRVEDALLFSL